MSIALSKHKFSSCGFPKSNSPCFYIFEIPSKQSVKSDAVSGFDYHSQVNYSLIQFQIYHLGLACDDRRFEILEGRCVNPAVPGAIPNWFGAPSYKLLPPTEDLFKAHNHSLLITRLNGLCRIAHVTRLFWLFVVFII